MPYYIVTGKLGGGKGLVSVARAEHYLLTGRPVATNMDLNLHRLLPKTNSSARVMRIPDHPTIKDLEIIGWGNTSYDEEKNGLLLLDEAGTWFNSRSWSDKSRKSVIDWLIHCRKYGWDLVLQVQDISMIDKQAQVSIAEHVVYCRRTDRFAVPVLSAFLKFLGIPLKLPRVHLGVVYYGTGKDAQKVETWTAFGSGYFSCYDTKQIFNPNYPHGIFSYLPPSYTHAKTISKKGIGFIMRLTHIYWKRFNKPLIFVVGFSLCLALFTFLGDDKKNSLDPDEKKSSVFSAQDSSSEIVRQKINYIQFSKYGIPQTDYIFNGKTYTSANLPFEVEWEGSNVYALLSVDKI